MTTPTRKPAWQEWTEKQWLEQVRKLASQLGWACYHPHQSKFSEPGYPDLTLVRERVVFAELKRHAASSKLSPHQELWRDLLVNAGAEYYLWRPADADDIIRILGRRQTSNSPKMQATRVPVVAGAQSANAGKGVIS